MKKFKKRLRVIEVLLVVIILSGMLAGVAFADDIDDPAPPPTLTEWPGPFNSPTWEQTVDNGDGTYTFSQVVNHQSTPPHYTGPWCTLWIIFCVDRYGFGEYSWYDEDYGWQHTFPIFANPDLLILDATLTIRAWDVDSEVWLGYNGEYDGISGDGVWLNPQYLQGTNDTWSVTVFDVDSSTLMDGVMNTWINIDMHHTSDTWATTLDYSRLDIDFTYSTNNPPYQPELSASPSGCVADGDDLVVTVTGPTPADPDGDPVTYKYRWFVDTGTGFYVDDEFAGRGDHTGSTVPAADTVLGDLWKVEVTPVSTFWIGTYEITAKGPKSEVSFLAIAESCNQPPTAKAGGPYTDNEGSAIGLDGNGSSDPDGDPLTYAWSVDSALCSFDDATSANPNLTCTDNGNFMVTLVVNDGQATNSDTAGVTVYNVAPTVSINSVAPTLVAVGESVAAAGSFTDPGTNDTHTVEWDWGDGSADSDNSHAYGAAGIYTIQLTVTDDDGGVGAAEYQFVVVYDPSAGFVTGGGWIDSPAGAYKPDTSLSGKANFGFVSKYQKGASVPTGNTEFQFHAADLNFHSSSYEWLVVTGSNYARFKGVGTINGEGEYKFMLWAGDGTGTDGADTFRIRIWSEDEVTAVETDIYDNGMDQDIGGGSIVIHTKK